MMHCIDSQVGSNRCLCGLFSDVAMPTRSHFINHVHYIDIYSCLRLLRLLLNEYDVLQNIKQEEGIEGLLYVDARYGIISKNSSFPFFGLCFLMLFTYRGCQ